MAALPLVSTATSPSGKGFELWSKTLALSERPPWGAMVGQLGSLTVKLALPAIEQPTATVKFAEGPEQAEERPDANAPHFCARVIEGLTDTAVPQAR
jgi:hypothetical protein